MTLYRQLLIVLQSLFLLIFVGTLVLGVQGVRAFLADQLAAHAQDTATSLGLSLSPAVEADDRATMTAMVDAIFDRGYYRSIVLESVDGRPLIERRLDVVVEGVPDWLVRWVPLETPEAEALVMAGWRQAATVRVVSHPGYAYRLLRDSLLELGAWFAALALLASLLAWGAVRLLLRPLHAVERQAEALCRREYDVQARLPRTRELRNIVLAMNRMIERVRAMFDDQAREAERLREQAFRDPLTGLGNRRLFEVRLAAALAPEAEPAGGMLALLRLEGLEELNQRLGYEAGDHLLREVAAALAPLAAEEGALLARPGGAEFALLLPGVDAAEAKARVIRACESTEAHLAAADVAEVRFRVGATLIHPGETTADVLAAADEALRAVEDGAPRHWAFYVREATAETEPHGRQDWLAHLDRVLDEGRLVLHAQPVVEIGAPERLFQREILVRIPGLGHGLHPAGSFIALAEHGPRALRLDRAVVARVLERPGTEPLALNLSAAALEDASFVDELVAGVRRTGARLAIELPEAVLVAQGDRLAPALARLRAAGCGLGVDHFGRGFGSLAYLKALHPDYVKLAHDYTLRLMADEETAFVLGTLVRAAHSLDIRVIAQGVEDQRQWARLRELGVDAVQGFAAGRPAAWGASEDVVV
ncbi:MAG: EAL domain-containing protein [Pseudomonadota bacterium]